MAHSAGDSTAVLTNLVPGRRRGGSCACPGAASRVVVPKSLSDRRPYTNSRVWLTGDQKLHSGRHGDVPSTWVPTMLGMTLQCPGWWHSGKDGRTGPEVTEETRSTNSYVTASSWAGVELVAVPLSRVSPSSFEGRDVEEVREWTTQC
jgi:hypothetical protein